MRKLFLMAAVGLCLSGMAYSSENEKEEKTENINIEKAAAEESGTLSKGESFMAAFGMGNADAGGETGIEFGSSANATAGMAAGTNVGNQGINTPFTPYTYHGMK